LRTHYVHELISCLIKPTSIRLLRYSDFVFGRSVPFCNLATPERVADSRLVTGSWKEAPFGDFQMGSPCRSSAPQPVSLVQSPWQLVHITVIVWSWVSKRRDSLRSWSWSRVVYKPSNSIWLRRW
jgi:hypothetical protein